METYRESDEDAIRDLLVGRRIVEAEMGGIKMPSESRFSYVTDPVGKLVLDNGKVVYVAGNEGGCACPSGCYYLQHVASVDNVITAVRVHSDPADDDGNGEGVYAIYVVADAVEINVAQFEGSDGNGYYGTGFELVVLPMTVDAT